jgi:outer membrane receptor for ferrienterochelin and colicins
MRKKVLLAAFVCCVVNPLFAESERVERKDSLYNDLSFNLNEIVVTGTGTDNRLKNSPVTMDVISKKELTNTAIPDFENAMIALNPSLSFSPTAMGSNIQLNGLGNRYILVLVNGKKLAGDVSGNTDLARINLKNVKQIEILKGAASSLYGSEAIGGVINIITDTPEEAVSVSSNTRYSGYGQFTQSVNATFQSDKFVSSTAYQRNQADGWQLSTQEILKDKSVVDTDKKAVNKFFSDVLSQEFTYKPVKDFSVYVQGSLFDKKFQRSIKSYNFDMKYDDYSWSSGAKYLWKDKGIFLLDVYADNFDYSKVYTVQSGNFQVDDKEKVRSQKYYDMHLKSILYLSNQHRLTLGAQYQIDYVHSKTDVIDGSKDIYTRSLYAQDEIKLLDDKLQIVPGIRYIYHETFESKLTPKLSVLYALKHFNFRGSYSLGFRAPDLKELYNNNLSGTTLSIGDQNLKPETSSYFSLNTEYIHRFFSVSVTAYTNQIKDMINSKIITETLTPDEISEGIKKKQQFANLSEARVRGIETNLNAYFGENFSLGAGYSYVDSKDYDTGTPLPRVSKHTGNFNIGWEKTWGIFHSYINMNGRIQSRKYYEDGETPPFSLFNLTTRHRMKSFNGFVPEVGFGVENIFNYIDDRPFGVNYATLSPGRTIFASLLITFSK